MSNDFEADAEANASLAMIEIGKLRQHISELEKSLETARKERDEHEAMGNKHLADLRARQRDIDEARNERDSALADLARIKPSGQVAEDVEKVRAYAFPADEVPFAGDVEAALDRIAAKAQSYEAIREAINDNYGADGDPLGRVKDLLEAEEEARSEAAVETDERHRVELERDREAARADKAEQERDAAVASNAVNRTALVRAAAELRHTYGHVSLGQSINPDLVARAIRMLEEATSRPNPGAALLEEVETLRQRQALWEEAANALYGYTVFVGPCAHGRDPWDRCDECGEESAVHALVKVNNALTEQHRKEVVRARNEGREQIASWLGQQWGEYELAERARALKEPEE